MITIVFTKIKKKDILLVFWLLETVVVNADVFNN